MIKLYTVQGEPMRVDASAVLAVSPAVEGDGTVSLLVGSTWIHVRGPFEHVCDAVVDSKRNACVKPWGAR